MNSNPNIHNFQQKNQIHPMFMNYARAVSGRSPKTMEEYSSIVANQIIKENEKNNPSDVRGHCN